MGLSEDRLTGAGIGISGRWRRHLVAIVWASLVSSCAMGTMGDVDEEESFDVGDESELTVLTPKSWGEGCGDGFCEPAEASWCFEDCAESFHVILQPHVDDAYVGVGQSIIHGRCGSSATPREWCVILQVYTCSAEQRAELVHMAAGLPAQGVRALVGEVGLDIGADVPTTRAVLAQIPGALAPHIGRAIDHRDQVLYPHPYDGYTDGNVHVDNNGTGAHMRLGIAADTAWFNGAERWAYSAYLFFTARFWRGAAVEECQCVERESPWLQRHPWIPAVPPRAVCVTRPDATAYVDGFMWNRRMENSRAWFGGSSMIPTSIAGDACAEIETALRYCHVEDPDLGGHAYRWERIWRGGGLSCAHCPTEEVCRWASSS